jgi:hypothetical protein
VVILVA